MTWSRFGALALSIPLLHLNFVRADSACDQHASTSGQAAVQHEMPTGDMSAHHHSAPADKSDKPDQSCDTPAQMHCCQAVMSCTPSLAEPTVARSEVLRPAITIATQVRAMPLSRVTPPEPPPPRA